MCVRKNRNLSNGWRDNFKGRSSASRPRGPGGYTCICCTLGPPRTWKRADRRLVRHAEKLTWPVEVQDEEDAFINEIVEMVHAEYYANGEHPMEDEIDRAMGLYPGTSVEVGTLAPQICVRLPLR